MAESLSQAPLDLAALTEVLAPRVRRLARHLSLRDADDGCQEVFRQLALALPGFRGESSPETWAHRIAVRTLLRVRRQGRRRSEREPNASELSLSIDETALASFAHEPFTLLIARERRERVHAALDALSPPLRDALVLRVLEQLSYAEIADALELPLGTVKSRIAAATLRVAERLQREGDDA